MMREGKIALGIGVVGALAVVGCLVYMVFGYEIQAGVEVRRATRAASAAREAEAGRRQAERELERKRLAGMNGERRQAEVERNRLAFRRREQAEDKRRADEAAPFKGMGSSDGELRMAAQDTLVSLVHFGELIRYDLKSGVAWADPVGWAAMTWSERKQIVDSFSWASGIVTGNKNIQVRSEDNVALLGGT